MYLGVPFPLNHTDITTAPAPLDLTSMDWSWQSGRKFAKIELVPRGPRGRLGHRQSATAWPSRPSSSTSAAPAAPATR